MIDVRSQTIFLDEDGIVHATLKPMVELTLADAEEAVEAIRTLSGERRRPVLVDLRKAKGMSREARVFFSGPVTATVESAAGLVVTSPLTRMIANFFMGLNKPLFPTRMFNTEEDAMAWLRTFV